MSFFSHLPFRSPLYSKPFLNTDIYLFFRKNFSYNCYFSIVLITSWNDFTLLTKNKVSPKKGCSLSCKFSPRFSSRLSSSFSSRKVLQIHFTFILLLLKKFRCKTTFLEKAIIFLFRLFILWKHYLKNPFHSYHSLYLVNIFFNPSKKFIELSSNNFKDFCQSTSFHIFYFYHSPNLLHKNNGVPQHKRN